MNKVIIFRDGNFEIVTLQQRAQVWRDKVCVKNGWTGLNQNGQKRFVEQKARAHGDAT